MLKQYFYLVEEEPNTKTGLLKNGLITTDLLGKYELSTKGQVLYNSLFYTEETKNKKVKSVWTLEEAIEMRDLFPVGIKAGTTTARSNKNTMLTKLNKFSSQHPEFSKELITKAFNKYVNEMRLRGWNFLSSSSNFVSKDGNSLLADICEEIKEGTSDRLKSDYKQA